MSSDKLSLECLASLSHYHSGTSDSESSDEDPRSRRLSSGQRAVALRQYLETAKDRVEDNPLTTCALEERPHKDLPNTGEGRAAAADLLEGMHPREYRGSPRPHKSGPDSGQVHSHEVAHSKSPINLTAEEGTADTCSDILRVQHIHKSEDSSYFSLDVPKLTTAVYLNCRVVLRLDREFYGKIGTLGFRVSDEYCRAVAREIPTSTFEGALDSRRGWSTPAAWGPPLPSWCFWQCVPGRALCILNPRA